MSNTIINSTNSARLPNHLLYLNWRYKNVHLIPFIGAYKLCLDYSFSFNTRSKELTSNSQPTTQQTTNPQLSPPIPTGPFDGDIPNLNPSNPEDLLPLKPHKFILRALEAPPNKPQVFIPHGDWGLKNSNQIKINGLAEPIVFNPDPALIRIILAHKLGFLWDYGENTVRFTEGDYSPDSLYGPLQREFIS